MGALYLVVLMLGVNNANNVQPVIAIERAVSYRERPAGMYAPLPYALAAVRWLFCKLLSFIYSGFSFDL